ncbi:flagellar FlbD family protein [bacterium]|nr:flagellar FlbD family protein [bacterium]MBU1599067.1 flagellar FlbD family protein [bacterium]MBU2461565.1 flagellar FlbD family protein [bacterium]
MIELTRLNGKVFLLNPHLIETIEETPDTVITLNSGQRYVVREGLDKIIEMTIKYRRSLRYDVQET